jgi:hypothetical protein
MHPTCKLFTEDLIKFRIVGESLDFRNHSADGIPSLTTLDPVERLVATPGAAEVVSHSMHSLRMADRCQ